MLHTNMFVKIYQDDILQWGKIEIKQKNIQGILEIIHTQIVLFAS